MAALSLGVWAGYNDDTIVHLPLHVWTQTLCRHMEWTESLGTLFVANEHFQWRASDFLLDVLKIQCTSKLKPGFPYKLPGHLDLPGQLHLLHLPLHQPHYPSGVPDLPGLTLTCL